jgi:hypothetical protein
MKMLRWVYRVIPLINKDYDAQTFRQKLNLLGNTGWELVQVYEKFIIFKRPEGFVNDVDNLTKVTVESTESGSTEE